MCERARARARDRDYRVISLTVLAVRITDILLNAVASEPCLMSAAIFSTLVVVVVVAVAVSIAAVVVVVVVVVAAAAAAAAPAATVAVDGN